mmetsp:Transcript_112538/g.257766  ORF Transcript_112538/g.257766 Transcript_112538/m.257766 type:complete len:200 (-) Transcript_112538:76-675(-)
MSCVRVFNTFLHFGEPDSTCGRPASVPPSCRLARRDNPWKARAAALPASSFRAEERKDEDSTGFTTVTFKGLRREIKVDAFVSFLREEKLLEHTDYVHVPLALSGKQGSENRTLASCGFAFVNFTSASVAGQAVARLHGVAREEVASRPFNAMASRLQGRRENEQEFLERVSRREGGTYNAQAVPWVRRAEGWVPLVKK